MSYLILISALSISVVSAYFSIIGLTTMFPSSFWSIVIMGSVLEVGKLVSASWLHHNWKVAPRTLKIYLSTAVVVLIFITSMGIFGFLSKSHIEHQKSSEENIILMAQLDSKVKRENEYIARQNDYINKLSSEKGDSSKKSEYNIDLEQKKIDDLYISLDKSIKLDNDEINRLNNKIKLLDQEIALLDSSSGGLFGGKKKKIEDLKSNQKPDREDINSKIQEAEDRISKMRDSTQSQIAKVRERIDTRQDDSEDKQDTSIKKEEYNSNIQSAYDRIDEMQADIFKYKNAELQLEAEVGPVKYVAELLEDLGAESIALAGAVRIVILILVFVFDPLAVVMLLAANLSFKLKKRKPYENIAGRLNSRSRTTQKPTTTTTTTQKPTTTTTTTQKPTTTTTTTQKPTTTTTTTQKPTTTTTTTQKPTDGEEDLTFKQILKVK